MATKTVATATGTEVQTTTETAEAHKARIAALRAEIKTEQDALKAASPKTDPLAHEITRQQQNATRRDCINC
jgi:hypothetical protein